MRLTVTLDATVTHARRPRVSAPRVCCVHNHMSQTEHTREGTNRFKSNAATHAISLSFDNIVIAGVIFDLSRCRCVQP
jgi:hypothetical protein